MHIRTLVAGSVVLGMCVAGCQHRVPAAAVTRATPAARTPEPPAPPSPPARLLHRPRWLVPKPQRHFLITAE